MTSSTGRSSGTRERAGALVCVALAFVLVHAVLGTIAWYAERQLDVYLWKEQDYLRLFSPAYHEGRGSHRLLIYGPSEAREAFLPEELAPGLPGLKPYQNAQSIGTLEDFLVVLDYLETAYSPSAIPREILLGINTRFVADIRFEDRRLRAPEFSPLFDGIDRYSPHVRVVRGQHPPVLARKSAIEATRARVAQLRLQADRYRRGLLAVALATPAGSWLSDYRRYVRPGKYLTGKLGPDWSTKRWLERSDTTWAVIRGWDPVQNRERVISEFGRVLDFTARHRIRLYVVNLPEYPYNLTLYPPGRYDAYIDLVRQSIGETPFVDLRSFLSDTEFFDDRHPTWDGAIRLSARVASFIREHRTVDQAVEAVP